MKKSHYYEPDMAVMPEHDSAKELAETLAKRFDLPLADGSKFDFFLVVTRTHLKLVQNSRHAPGAVYAEFVGGEVGHRRKHGKEEREPLGLALGIYKNKFKILDATVGMGKDSAWMAANGADVVGYERSAIVHALVDNGLTRAMQDKFFRRDLRGTLEFRYGDAIEIMPTLTGDDIPDVVYIDVMYPPKSKKMALPSKDMQVLRKLIGDDEDAEELFKAARKVAKNRVVVKRPSYAEELGANPSITYTYPKTRFDVYFSNDKR